MEFFFFFFFKSEATPCPPEIPLLAHMCSWMQYFKWFHWIYLIFNSWKWIIGLNEGQNNRCVKGIMNIRPFILLHWIIQCTERILTILNTFQGVATAPPYFASSFLPISYLSLLLPFSPSSYLSLLFPTHMDWLWMQDKFLGTTTSSPSHPHIRELLA